MLKRFKFWFYLFGDVKLAKSTDSYKYVYSGYGTGFDSRSEFSL